MADTKISDLTLLADAGIAPADLLVVVDTSASATKKFAVSGFDARFIGEADVAAKGDMFVATANDAVAILSVGADGRVLTADSGAATGVSWQVPASAPVTSVNGATGVVVLDADDIDDTATTNKFATAAQLSKIDGVEAGATADQTASEVPIVDAGGKYTATDVEGALAEVKDVADAAAGGGITLEQVQDDLGNTSLIAGTSLTKVYDDTAGTITLNVDATDFATSTQGTKADNAVPKKAATTQSGTTYTVDADDDDSTVICSNAAAVAVTIPTGLTVGYRVLLFAAGAGGLSLTTTGNTLLGSAPNVAVAQNQGIYVEVTASNTLLVLGGTA